MMRTSTRPWMAVLLAAGVAVLTGCDDDEDTTGPPPPEPEVGDVSAVVMDDAAAEGEPGEANDFSGTLTGNARVEVQAEGETEFTDLGQDEEITVTLQAAEGEETTITAVTEADAGSYTSVRLVLTGAQVQIDAGSTIEETTLEEDSTLTVGAEAETDEVVIEEQVTFDVTTDAETTFTFDLNSGSWVTQAALDAGDVDPTTIEGAGTVTPN